MPLIILSQKELPLTTASLSANQRARKTCIGSGTLTIVSCHDRSNVRKCDLGKLRGGDLYVQWRCVDASVP